MLPSCAKLFEGYDLEIDLSFEVGKMQQHQVAPNGKISAASLHFVVL